ncbi:hypothetical protein AOQ84DRAFT_90882 [Glonium stellatum]|uniref:Uncharacterized protein n=1 Tax=Glonium stellatum TaxID=574774 RepID=A0A8E2EVX6_9PEZI|nr:hypothetical protein AOQ84DRAFT_90882 [Glonium stellatum]
MAWLLRNNYVSTNHLSSFLYALCDPAASHSPGSFGQAVTSGSLSSTVACFALRIGGGEAVGGFLVQSRLPLRARSPACSPLQERWRQQTAVSVRQKQPKGPACKRRRCTNSSTQISPTDDGVVSGICGSVRRYRRGAAACVCATGRAAAPSDLRTGQGIRKRARCFSRGNDGQQETKFKAGDPFN